MNDCEPLLCFAQQVNGYGKSGDVFLGISTSGNSKNVLFAATTAHAKGMKVIGLTGAKDSKLKDMSDVCIKAPQTETYMIQELHLPIYEQLTSPYGEGFPADAAQYAVDHMTGVDWNVNALEKAKEYYYKMSMSKSAVYEQLTSDYGEQFTASQARYAVDHLD